MSKRMYIICREDLSPLYASIQGGHALAAHALEHPDDFKDWNNSFLIYLKKKNEKGLQKLYEKLTSCGVKCGKFYEPDLNGSLTSISCYTDKKNMRGISTL